MVLGERRAAPNAFQATRLNSRDALAGDHWLLACMPSGTWPRRRMYAEGRLQDPTDLVPRAPLACRGEKEMQAFVEGGSGFVGEDEFEMLETTSLFAELGLMKEAAKLLYASAWRRCRRRSRVRCRCTILPGSRRSRRMRTRCRSGCAGRR
jgi:hypothetical protein